MRMTEAVKDGGEKLNPIIIFENCREAVEANLFAPKKLVNIWVHYF